MEKDITTAYHPCTLRNGLSEAAVLVIGAGRFGGRAIGILKDLSFSPIFVVDEERKSLERIQTSSVQRVRCDGVSFLTKNLPILHPSVGIIPAIPLHLAFEWLKSTLKGGRPVVCQVPVPTETRAALPHTWQGSEGSLLVSYADFKCPDDCPEPEGFCTVTKKRRGLPLYDLLEKTAPKHFSTHIIRSRQLAPGLGGYKVGDLRNLLDRIKKKGKGHWLVGTACKCHGTVTALEILGDAGLQILEG